MAILAIVASNRPVADGSARWKAGEIWGVFEDTQSFGWYEAPIRWQGTGTVAQVNSSNLQQNATDLYKTWKITDNGTITAGTQSFAVVANDVITWMWGGYFQKWDKQYNASDVSGKNFQIRVSDKTKAEVDAYMQAWRHDPVTSQVSATGDNRLIETVSTMVSQSGKHAFTQTEVDAVVTELNNSGYTTSYNSHTNTSFRLDIVASVEDRDQIIARINDTVRNHQYARRRYWITSAGITWLAGQGGIANVTAAELAPHLQDGLTT